MLSIDELINEAKKAREKAYARYSGFKVGAVIECKDGKLICGANIENSSYGLTMWAERNADFLKTNIKELLPYSFNGEDLKKWKK